LTEPLLIVVTDVNKEFMFQHMYGSLPTSVFDRVGVLREFLCVRYGCCSQALLSCDERILLFSFYVCSIMYILFYFFLLDCVLLCDFHIK